MSTVETRSRGPRWLPLTLASLVSVCAGCDTLRLAPPASEKVARAEKELALKLPGKYQNRVSQFVFFSDFEMKRDQPLLQDLGKLREQVRKELELPPASAVVQVYIFEDRERYEAFMKTKYPDLPPRRAFFVAQPHGVGNGEDLLVYTYWGERIQEDLRHELTHSLLHSVLKDVPLWLDEGLAEFFELPPDRQGVNTGHLENLRLNSEGPFRPNLERLEQLSQVEQMRPAEYREAWAWVHFMLRGNPACKPVLISYLQQLRTNPTPGPLQPRLAAVSATLDEALQKHVASLQSVRSASATQE